VQLSNLNLEIPLGNVLAEVRSGLGAHQTSHIGHVPGGKGVEVTEGGGAQARGEHLGVNTIQPEVLLSGLLLLNRLHGAHVLAIVSEQHITGLQGVGQLEALGGGHEMGISHASSLAARGGDDNTLGGGRVGHGALGLLAGLELLIGVLDALVVDLSVDMEADRNGIITNTLVRIRR